MKVVDINMLPGSSKTTLLVAMLKGFNRYELTMMFVGSEEQCQLMVNYHSIPKEWTYSIHRLLDKKPLMLPKNIVFDDCKYNELFARQRTGSGINELISGIDHDGYAYMFKSYPRPHAITINPSETDMKLIKLKLNEASHSLDSISSILQKC